MKTSKKNMEEYMKMFLEKTSFYNEIVLPKKLFSLLPHFLSSWLRTTLCAFVIYPIAAFFCLDFWKRYVSSSKETMPSKRAMISQAIGALISIPVNTLFSTMFEWMIENGWSRCYPRISDVGWQSYVLHTLTYLFAVEFGIYWAHRLLHEIKPIYKYIHAPHHRYSKEIALSPFAGWSGHPLDGAIQETPYGLILMFMPIHFTTLLALFLVEAVWGIIIHDRSDAKGWPIMGSNYHTIHHTSGHHNYGNYTILMDWLFGTLRHPKSTTNGIKVQ
ncbi:delta(7)-sterol-C5(6)-desaturase-like [Chenopodium quinoa]|uniref:delta(7)-sterol-C5(6)-desaturase-like n=1 Tax=Chenopodium quinoa TaxID=63459 RepID=UPI000B799246|nr:delta(7)-sterol-C5(6)-desaturase-like [Chenopodium quinoa]